MAHFYASAQGSRGETHRLGGKTGGARVTVKGWHDSVSVYAYYDEEKKENYYIIYTGHPSSGEEKARVSAKGIITLTNKHAKESGVNGALNLLYSLEDKEGYKTNSNIGKAINLLQKTL